MNMTTKYDGIAIRQVESAVVVHIHGDPLRLQATNVVQGVVLVLPSRSAAEDLAQALRLHNDRMETVDPLQIRMEVNDG